MKKPSFDEDVLPEAAKRGRGGAPPLIPVHQGGGLARSIGPWRRRMSTILSLFPPSGPRPTGRPGGLRVPRARLLPFFPPGFVGGNAPLKCPSCRRETLPGSDRCVYCRQLLAEVSPQASVLKMPVWSTLILVAAVALGAYSLGRRSNPAGAAMARRPLPPSVAVVIPTPKSSLTRGRFVTGAGMTETGPTWAVYTSLDRLTDRPLFGARFGNQTGAQLFNVLCANGRSVLALDRGRVPSPEGATGNGKSVVAAIETSRRAVTRERPRMELRFDETPAELADVAPRLPGVFLRRVAASRRIRTATEEFDTTGLGAFVERVIVACGFDSALTEGVRPLGSKVQP